MHPTRRKLVDMVQTGKYEKNTTVGWTSKKIDRKVGDIWEDDHNRYEQKEGYVLKTGKNHEQMQEIRKFLEQQTACKNPNCKTVKKTKKIFIWNKRSFYYIVFTISRNS